MNTIEVLNPATGEVVETVKKHTEEEIELAISRGHEAFKEWKKTNAHFRSRLLFKWSELIQENKE